ncbi:hypothetical protein [Paenibacillus tepidiphilus]|uniref:hypothetical protein n=1 Tax=Paenibacillus tepidiphilus TaxID=2608683 RepID=UPI00123AA8DF|nr:hypothetical protein [Paenibacillus tepidiphilus]
MKHLIGFELRKLLILRVWIILAAAIGFTAFWFISTAYPKGMNSILAVYKAEPERVKQLIGPVDPQLAEKYAYRLDEERAEDSDKPDEEKITAILEQHYTVTGYQANLFKQEVLEAQQKIARMEERGEQNTFAYRDLSKWLTMWGSLELPGFYVTEDWLHLFLYTSGFPGVCGVWIGLLLAFGLAPLFAGETVSRMDALILSSPSGRLRIVAAKTAAAVLFAVCSVTLIFASTLLIACLPFGFIGWDAPLNDLYPTWATPYHLNMLQAFILQYGIALIGAISFAVVIGLLSALLRSSISTSLIAAGMVIAHLFLNDRWSVLLPTFLLNSGRLLQSYSTYNWFGYPVLYAPFALACTLIIGILAALLSPVTFSRWRRSPS